MTIIIDACNQQINLGFFADCTAAETIGDPVVFSSSVDELVEKLSDNVYGSKLVAGLVHSKSSDTRCFVITAGVFYPPGASYTRGEVVWVSTSGGTTTTKPVTGHLQTLGLAIAPGGISVGIDTRKTIQA
jgi:hypothetical protein